MTNTELLDKKIKDSGKTKLFIASKLGISREAFYKKLRNKNQFKQDEMVMLCKLLDIETLEEFHAIFFAGEVDI